MLGPGAAVVRVSADIDSESTTRTEERYDPEGQVIRTETSTDDTTITKESESAPATDTGAGAGAGANTPGFRGDGPNAQKTVKDSEQSKKNKTQNYEINRITINSVKGPGSIARVTAAVFIAAKATPRTPAEMDGLRRMVANSIGIKGEDKELMKIVTLEEVAFENPVEPKTGAMDTLLAHPDMLKNGVAIGVALILFVIFLRMLKGAKPDEIPMELLESQRSAQVEGAAAGPVTAQMLNDMIRQKPDNVGLALRDWMSSDSKN